MRLTLYTSSVSGTSFKNLGSGNVSALGFIYAIVATGDKAGFLFMPVVGMEFPANAKNRD